MRKPACVRINVPSVHCEVGLLAPGGASHNATGAPSSPSTCTKAV